MNLHQEERDFYSSREARRLNGIYSWSRTFFFWLRNSYFVALFHRIVNIFHRYHVVFLLFYNLLCYRYSYRIIISVPLCYPIIDINSRWKMRVGQVISFIIDHTNSQLIFSTYTIWVRKYFLVFESNSLNRTGNHSMWHST